MKSAFDATISVCMEQKDFIKIDMEPFYTAIDSDQELKDLTNKVKERLELLANQNKIPCKVKVNFI